MSFSRPGAIDLSALNKPAAPAGAPATSGTFVVNVTEQNFQQIALEASQQYVVVLSLWSSRAPQSETFNQVLAQVTESFGGHVLLAQVDVDTNPAIVQAVGAKGVPHVLGLVKGQPVPLFEGIKEETEVRAIFQELLRVAAENGVSGRISGEPVAAEEPEPVDDPRFAQADEAFATGDFAAAIAEYEKVAAQYPADVEVSERLAGVKLLERTKDADLQAARKAAGDTPGDLDAQLLVADLDVSGGHVQDAFDRLIEVIRGLPADERDPVRERLLELFLVVGTSDPSVAAARRALAAVLY
jgi:putative thioredoxin